MSFLGLAPHPILELPPPELLDRPELRPKLEAMILERARLMEMERANPRDYGFEPEIWRIVDDLLVDGHKVILDVSRLERIGCRKPIVPLELDGRSEIWIAGSNRSSKSEYAAKKIIKVLDSIPSARTWSFADTGPVSKARQQPLFFKYLPIHVKKMAAATGKAKKGPTLNISYGQKGGFTEENFVLDNGSQHWFKNYEQDIENVEGDQLDAVWFDELRNIELLKTIRGRMGDRGGIIIVTFTSIDENYSAIVNEYERGARTLLEVPAIMLPIKKPKKNFSRRHSQQEKSTPDIPKDPEEPGSPADSLKAEVKSKNEEAEFEIIGYKPVPRIKIAGPGSDGNQRANIVYFHITDNPYYGYEDALKQFKRTGRFVKFGAERFYKLYRGATEAKIKSRVYGLLQAGSAQQFPKFNDLWHCLDPEQIPSAGTNYHVVDPCDGRNWFMLWIRIDPRGRWFVYREWPSHGHSGPSSYIPGFGQMEPWTLPGQPADGVRGPAQNPLGLGLDRYKQEILRCEGNCTPEEPTPATDASQENQTWWRRRAPHRTILKRKGEGPAADTAATTGPATTGPEEIEERHMDCRYGNTPTTTREGRTTLLEQMSEIDMEFLSAPTESQILGNETGSIHLINGMLDYDEEVERGRFSPRLARLNEPMLFISRQCPNLIYSMREWTGKDKGHGACKDPIDCLRYAALADLDYVGEEAYAWQ